MGRVAIRGHSKLNTNPGPVRDPEGFCAYYYYFTTLQETSWKTRVQCSTIAGASKNARG